LLLLLLLLLLVLRIGVFSEDIDHCIVPTRRRKNAIAADQEPAT
jgi:hypothetical protein